jgi:DNA polymerase-1
MVKELLESLSVPVVELEGWEGDDILGTLAWQASQAGVECLLVTGDKDALQLVDNNTQVVNTKTGMSDVVIYDSAAVVERWGVPPKRVPDFLGLMGDSSDNIPGVPGVGEKKARLLLEQYGTLEDVLANASEVKGKLGESLREHADLARASRDVATIRRDVPVTCDFSSVRFPAYDAQQVTASFRKFALTSQLRKMLQLIGEQPVVTAGSQPTSVSEQPAVTAGSQPTSVGEQSLISTSSFLAADEPTESNERGLLFLTGDAAQIALDKTLASEKPLAITIEDAASQGSLFSESEPVLFVATAGQVLNLGSATTEVLSKIITKAALLVAFDLKAIFKFCLPPDTCIPATIDFADLDPNRFFDCCLAAYLLDSTRPPASISDLLQEYPQATVAPDLINQSVEALATSTVHQPAEAVSEAACQAVALLNLAELLNKRLIDDGADDCFRHIEMPLVAVLVNMERVGVNLELNVLAELNTVLTGEIESLRNSAIAAAGETFNLDSPKQLATVLFENLKLPALKKTRTGYSTDISVLEELKLLHPLPALMIEYRELAKLKSTYLDTLPHLIAGDGHIHTTFNQSVTATGRLSSADPNLQNIPVRKEIGRNIRRAFIPAAKAIGATEAVLLSADYSQIELRLLAHFSADSKLIEAFIAGEDFHTMTAAQVWQVQPDAVTPELRSRAKAVNFGIVYGQQAYGLSQSLGCSFSEAQMLIDSYFKTFPDVKQYLDKTVAEAHRQGWVETLFGRRRYIRELYSSNLNQRHFGERTAMNHPMQGSAADIIKLAMIEVARRLDKDGFRSQLILQVHDELVFNCASDEVESLSTMISQVMEGVTVLRVPLVVGLATGDNWALAH